MAHASSCRRFGGVDCEESSTYAPLQMSLTISLMFGHGIPSEVLTAFAALRGTTVGRTSPARLARSSKCLCGHPADFQLDGPQDEARLIGWLE